MWRRGGGGRRVDVRLGGTGGGGGALEGFRLAFDGPVYRSAYRYAAPAWSAAGLLRWPRARLRSPYVVGTSLMASRYGLAVPLGDRSCAASTSTSLVSSPSVRVDGGARAHEVPPGVCCHPIPGTRRRGSSSRTRCTPRSCSPTWSPSSSSPPRLDLFRVAMALYSIAKKMFGDPFGPLSPPSMVLWMPPMSPVRGLDGPVTTGFAGSTSAPTGSWGAEPPA